MYVQFIEGLTLIQMPYYEVNMIHSEVSRHLEKVWKDIFIENKGDYKKQLNGAISCELTPPLITLCSPPDMNEYQWGMNIQAPY